MPNTDEQQNPSVLAVAWFTVLVNAWQKNDFARAAEAKQHLQENGITVKLPPPVHAGKAVAR